MNEIYLAEFNDAGSIGIHWSIEEENESIFQKVCSVIDVAPRELKFQELKLQRVWQAFANLPGLRRDPFFTSK